MKAKPILFIPGVVFVMIGGIFCLSWSKNFAVKPDKPVVSIKESAMDDSVFAKSTLDAFKTARELKGRYDSVVWFAHLGDKTYYYVAKGQWSFMPAPYYGTNESENNAKMGMVGPDLKEVIPAEYDLIHNINATFPGLVEVEKVIKRAFTI